MAVTRLGLEGFGVRRVGSFLGRLVNIPSVTIGYRTVYAAPENRTLLPHTETREVVARGNETRTVLSHED